MSESGELGIFEDGGFVTALVEELWDEGKERECPVCGKVLPTRWHVRRHMGVHLTDEERERPFPCDTCGRQFLTLYYLKRHSTVHAGKRFYCKVCGKGYKQRHDLANHSKLHSDPEAIRCPTCSFHFSSVYALQAHKKRKH